MFEVSFQLSTPYTDLHNLHGAVKRILSEFEDQERGYQYRALISEDKTHILARSATKLNSSTIPWHEVDTSFAVGDHVRINLLANAVSQVKGKKKAIYGEKAEAFFHRHIDNAGLEAEVIQFSEPFSNPASKPTAKKAPIKVHSQEVVATCVVKDVEKLTNALAHGLGRSKHLGYGMLILEKVTKNV